MELVYNNTHRLEFKNNQDMWLQIFSLWKENALVYDNIHKLEFRINQDMNLQII